MKPVKVSFIDDAAKEWGRPCELCNVFKDTSLLCFQGKEEVRFLVIKRKM